MKHDVFISYSRKDSEIADKIYETLTENNITCFIDRVDISGGEEFSPRLAEEIKKSTIFLFLGSENSYMAKWTPKELHYAVRHKDKVAIIPYLIDDKSIPSAIEFLVLDLNIRNIKDHPIETVLVDDIKKAMEKLAPKAGKEDLSMVKSVIESILSSQHTKQYNIDLLTHLGDFNWKNRFLSSREPDRPKEAKEYYRSALELSRDFYSQKQFGEDQQVAKLFASIADIEKDSNHVDEAEKNYSEAIQRYRLQVARLRSRDSLIECLLKLVEIRISSKEFGLAEDHCLEIKDLLSVSDRQRSYLVSQQALNLCELWSTILSEQGKGLEAVRHYDDVLDLFRDNEKMEKNSFSEMLYEFAKSIIKNGDLANAERYLKEAITLNSENLASLLEIARLYEGMGRQDDAVQAYNKCFELVMKIGFPLRPSALRPESVVDKVVRYLDGINRGEDAENCLLLAIAKCKVDLFQQKTSNARICVLYENYSDYLYRHKRFSESLSYLKQCEQIAQMPEVNARPTALLRFAVKSAQRLYCLGLGKEAILRLNTTLEKDKEVLVTQSIIPLIYESIKSLRLIQFDPGVASLKQFMLDNFLNLEIKDKDAQASYYTTLGWYLMLLEEYDQARKPLEKALELAGKENRPNALNNLGRLYASIGLYDEAEKLLREASAHYEVVAKTNSWLLAGLAENQSYMGLLYLNQGNPAAATVYLEKALSNYKEYSRIFDSRKENHEQTEQWLEKAKASL